MQELNKIYQGDCLERLKELESDSVDSIVTDPPYGYSFMGKDWDKAVPSVEVWEECLRVLKPGGFAFVMSAPRSDVCSRMSLRLEEAGFKIDFTPIYWTYASGFPKAMNIGKMVDKRQGNTRQQVPDPEARRRNKTTTKFSGVYGEIEDKTDFVTKGNSPLEGSYGGFQPKPAVEVIIVAMKPLSEKTYVDQALKNGKGITWLDDCRVPANEGEYDIRHYTNEDCFVNDKPKESQFQVKPQPSGRFPANLLISDNVLGGIKYDVISCETGGIMGTYATKEEAENHKPYCDDVVERIEGNNYSRYFDLDAWAKTLPFLIVPKASKSEKDKGLEHMEEQQIVSMATANGTSGKPSSITEGRDTRRRNHHPTVKPLKLMSYLITLGSREGDVVLDPFAGSGTTCLAAKELRRNYIGIEREEEYVKIAEARLASVQPQLDLLGSK